MQGTMTYPPRAQADGDEEELQSETYVGMVLEGFSGSLLPVMSANMHHDRCCLMPP